MKKVIIFNIVLLLNIIMFCVQVYAQSQMKKKSDSVRLEFSKMEAKTLMIIDSTAKRCIESKTYKKAKRK